jgi:hypothetical protein
MAIGKIETAIGISVEATKSKKGRMTESLIFTLTYRQSILQTEKSCMCWLIYVDKINCGRKGTLTVQRSVRGGGQTASKLSRASRGCAMADT